MLRSRRRSRIVWIVIALFLVLVLSIHFLAPHHQTEEVHPPQIVEYNYINKQFVHIGEAEPDKELVPTKMDTNTTRPPPLRRENINTDVHIFYYYWYRLNTIIYNILGTKTNKSTVVMNIGTTKFYHIGVTKSIRTSH